MSLVEKLLAGLILLTFVTVVLLNASASDQIIQSLAKFNQRTFGMFLVAPGRQAAPVL